MPPPLISPRPQAFGFSYDDYLEAERADCQRRYERQLQSEALKGLKSRVRDEATEVVKEQRLAHMCEGAYFMPVAKGKIQDKMRFFIMLAKNKKSLHWGDPEDGIAGDVGGGGGGGTPYLTSLPHSVLVEDVKQFVVGKDLPAFEKKKAVSEEQEGLAFGIHHSQDEWLTAVAPDKREASIWMDGIRFLTGERHKTAEAQNDIDTLFDIRCSVRLLNLHDVELPDAPPQRPAPCASTAYNFM